MKTGSFFIPSVEKINCIIIKSIYTIDMYETIKNCIKKLPKIELHFHLEGAFSFNALWSLSQKYNPNLSYVDFKQIFNVFDFPSFIKAWEYKNSLIRTIDDLAFLCDDVINYLKSENIVYVEITISPFGLKNLKAEDVVCLLFNKFLLSDIQFIFIGDIVRNTKLTDAYRKYYFYKEMRNYGIKGIGLGGDEKNYDSRIFKDIFNEAKKDNFKITIHAGEYGSEENIKNSILYCCADRIGHGNNIKTNDLILLIKNKGIHIELCPLSNKILNKNFSLKKYSFYNYWINNLSISINSDDPGMFSKTLSDNYLFILENYNLKITDLIKIQKKSLESCFCDNETKSNILKII